MYDVIKIAGLSAALAGALVVAAGQHNETPTAGKFLTDRIDAQPVRTPKAAPNAVEDTSTSCTGTWPYRSCDATESARPRVRLIAAGSSSASASVLLGR